MSYQNRQLLDLAQQLPCTLRLPGCTMRDCVPAHSNAQADGKGKGQKASDCFFASACQNCHFLIDQDKTMSRAERRDAWVKGFMLTVEMLWQMGLVTVSGTKPREPLPAKMIQRQKYSASTAKPSKIIPRRPQ